MFRSAKYLIIAVFASAIRLSVIIYSQWRCIGDMPLFHLTCLHWPLTQLNWVQVRKIMQILRNISQEIHFSDSHFSKFLCYSIMGWPYFNFMELTLENLELVFCLFFQVTSLFWEFVKLRVSCIGIKMHLPQTSQMSWFYGKSKSKNVLSSHIFQTC